MRIRSRKGLEKRRIRTETEKQRWDRNFSDLLQELRVAQAGIPWYRHNWIDEDD
jgi:hypothetical protein